MFTKNTDTISNTNKVSRMIIATDEIAAEKDEKKVFASLDKAFSHKTSLGKDFAAKRPDGKTYLIYLAERIAESNLDEKPGLISALHWTLDKEHHKKLTISGYKWVDPEIDLADAKNMNALMCLTNREDMEEYKNPNLDVKDQANTTINTSQTDAKKTQIEKYRECIKLLLNNNASPWHKKDKTTFYPVTVKNLWYISYLFEYYRNLKRNETMEQPHNIFLKHAADAGCSKTLEYLLRQPKKPWAHYENYDVYYGSSSLLREAIKKNNYADLKLLVDAGISVDKEDENRVTPLMHTLLALEKGLITRDQANKIIELFNIKQGSTNDIMIAIEHNAVNAVKILIDEYNNPLYSEPAGVRRLNSETRVALTPAMIAVKLDRREILDIFLEKWKDATLDQRCYGRAYHADYYNLLDISVCTSSSLEMFYYLFLKKLHFNKFDLFLRDMDVATNGVIVDLNQPTQIKKRNFFYILDAVKAEDSLQLVNLAQKLSDRDLEVIAEYLKDNVRQSAFFNKYVKFKPTEKIQLPPAVSPDYQIKSDAKILDLSKQIEGAAVVPAMMPPLVTPSAPVGVNSVKLPVPAVSPDIQLKRGVKMADTNKEIEGSPSLQVEPPLIIPANSVPVNDVKLSVITGVPSQSSQPNAVIAEVVAVTKPVVLASASPDYSQTVMGMAGEMISKQRSAEVVLAAHPKPIVISATKSDTANTKRPLTVTAEVKNESQSSTQTPEGVMEPGAADDLSQAPSVLKPGNSKTKFPFFTATDIQIRSQNSSQTSEGEMQFDATEGPFQIQIARLEDVLQILKNANKTARSKISSEKHLYNVARYARDELSEVLEHLQMESVPSIGDSKDNSKTVILKPRSKSN